MKSQLKIAALAGRVTPVRAATLVVGCILSICFVGCSTTRASKPALISATRLPSFNYTGSRATNYYLTVYNNAMPAEKVKVRNAILNDLMAVIDFNYHEFEAQLRSEKVLKNTAADIVTLGLTAASTAVGGEEAKTILSAIATGVVGANTALDKNVFQNNTVEALELEMRSLRALKEQDLINGMADTDAHYPLQSGIRDVIAYYYAGSLTDAMLGLVEKTGADAQANRANATEARRAVQARQKSE
jgi:hypothetical protein